MGDVKQKKKKRCFVSSYNFRSLTEGRRRVYIFDDWIFFFVLSPKKILDGLVLQTMSFEPKKKLDGPVRQTMSFEPKRKKKNRWFCSSYNVRSLTERRRRVYIFDDCMCFVVLSPKKKSRWSCFSEIVFWAKKKTKAYG